MPITRGSIDPVTGVMEGSHRGKSLCVVYKQGSDNIFKQKVVYLAIKIALRMYRRSRLVNIKLK